MSGSNELKSKKGKEAEEKEDKDEEMNNTGQSAIENTREIHGKKESSETATRTQEGNKMEEVIKAKEDQMKMEEEKEEITGTKVEQIGLEEEKKGENLIGIKEDKKKKEKGKSGLGNGKKEKDETGVKEEELEKDAIGSEERKQKELDEEDKGERKTGPKEYKEKKEDIFGSKEGSIHNIYAKAIDEHDKDYISIEEAKKYQIIKTDILDKYQNAVIHIKELARKEDKKMLIYKVKDKSKEYILKVLEINKKDRYYSNKLETIRNGYNTMKKLGEEIPFYIKAYECRELTIGDNICIEILMEYGGETLNKLKNTATEKQIKLWIIQSLDAFAYSAERKVCHFDIKPDNITYTKGKIKIIDLDASVQFDWRDDVEKTLEKIGKNIDEYTECYAPPEIWKKLQEIF